MALFQRSQIGVKEFGQTVTVPNDPKAKLMYYLNCVCTVLDLHDKVPRRLTQYSTNYISLTQDEITDLLALCILFSPEILKDKVFFEDTSSFVATNRFLELSSVKSSMLVAGNVLIGGENRRVAKVMTCTRAWLQNNYEQPMRMLMLSRGISGYQTSPTIRIGGPPLRPALQAPPAQPRYDGTNTYSNNNRNSSNGSTCCCVIV